MPKPVLYFGRRNQPAVVRAGDTELDHTEPFNVKAKTNRVAPAGAGGECVFTLVYLTVTFTASLTLYVTPFVDDTALEKTAVLLTENAAQSKQTRVYEIGLSIPLKAGDGTERGRYGPRGTWFQVMIETLFQGAGVPFTIEQVEYEYEPVTETKTITGAAT